MNKLLPLFILLLIGCSSHTPLNEMNKVDNPKKLFSQAQNSYDSSRYIEAILRFEHINKKYPKFDNIDESEYLIANSYEKLGLDDSAMSKYSQISNSENSSVFRPNSMVGKMSIYYKHGYYKKAEELGSEISVVYTSSPVMSEVNYLRGQVAYRDRNFEKAMKHLSYVSDSSFIPYALFTKAQCYRNLGKSNQALKTLDRLLTMDVHGSAQQIIKYKGRLLAGHILQDENRVKEGMEQYMKIIYSLDMNDEVYLALAWGFLKHNKTDAASGYTDNVIFSYKNSVLVPEAYMVKGMAKHLDQNFPKAIEYYDSALVLLQKLPEQKEQQNKSYSNKALLLDLIMAEMNTMLNDLDFTKDDIQSKRDSLVTKMKKVEAITAEGVAVKESVDMFEDYLVSYEKMEAYINELKGNAMVGKVEQEKQRIMEEIRNKPKFPPGCNCIKGCPDELGELMKLEKLEEADEEINEI